MKLEKKEKKCLSQADRERKGGLSGKRGRNSGEKIFLKRIQLFAEAKNYVIILP